MDADKLQKILVMHGKFLRGAEGGVRANLTGADLTGANLTHANLFSANLSDANLTDANLNCANLFSANLTRAAGNRRQVKSLQFEKYSVTYTASVLQIGCKNYKIDDWWGFDDLVISKMDRGALDWWRRWKPILRQIIEMSPATPTGHETKA